MVFLANTIESSSTKSFCHVFAYTTIERIASIKHRRAFNENDLLGAATFSFSVGFSGVDFGATLGIGCLLGFFAMYH